MVTKMTTENLNLILTSDLEAKITSFKQWRNAINGVNDSNAVKIDAAISTLQLAVDKLKQQQGDSIVSASIIEQDNYTHVVLYQGMQELCSFDIPKSVNSDPLWGYIV